MHFLEVPSLVLFSFFNLQEVHPLSRFDELSLTINYGTDPCPEFQSMFLLPRGELDSTWDLKYWDHLPPTLISLPFMYKCPYFNPRYVIFPVTNIWRFGVSQNWFLIWFHPSYQINHLILPSKCSFISISSTMIQLSSFPSHFWVTANLKVSLVFLLLF